MPVPINVPHITGDMGFGIRASNPILVIVAFQTDGVSPLHVVAGLAQFNIPARHLGVYPAIGDIGELGPRGIHNRPPIPAPVEVGLV